MKGLSSSIILLFLLPLCSFAQQITYSEPLKEDVDDMNFEIIGKMNNHVLIFKNLQKKYAISVYNDSMRLTDKIDLDYIPDKTFNVDFVSYPDFFYLVYQYSKKGVVYCMAAKLDGNGQKQGEPVILDTTHVGTFGDTKVYSTINSDDKQKIFVFKIQKKNDVFNFATILFDKFLQPIHSARLALNYDDSHDGLSDFLVDNDGNFIFAKSTRKGSRSNISEVTLVTKSAMSDTFALRKIDLRSTYLDEIKIKIDNVNKRYLLNSFYLSEKRGNIQGLLCNIWDVKGDSTYASEFIEFDESVRALAISSRNKKTAFNDFYIRNIILKKDGGYLIAAEDYTTESNGRNSFNRWDYPYGYNSFSTMPLDYYYYSPGFGYRRSYGGPYNSFQRVRYIYKNIVILSINKMGQLQWNQVINKDQYDDNSENFMSFANFITGSEIHFLYNDITSRDKFLADNALSADGTIKRNPTMKSLEKVYEFMPRFIKQVGARQIVVPCAYRNRICFARIDF